MAKSEIGNKIHKSEIPEKEVALAYQRASDVIKMDQLGDNEKGKRLGYKFVMVC